VARSNATAETSRQKVYLVEQADKHARSRNLCAARCTQVLVFTNKITASRLARQCSAMVLPPMPFMAIKPN